MCGAVEVTGVYDRESNCKFDLALAGNSWRVRASKLLKGSQKPSFHQVQRLLKEGLTINIALEDYFWHRLETMKQFGLQWAMKAKKYLKFTFMLLKLLQWLFTKDLRDEIDVSELNPFQPVTQPS
ncbi:hypothetical protein L1987_69941 [Smallanthus sonchifolius]|uniref:Uncharacterized protein n=1 Tax=Smallanthus sonchifolius TaxID=185202 RepID=A0ACB9B836_9ASTR|nr:hypothetical protein L1987_69941 [Smallanthus sonchifolius]